MERASVPEGEVHPRWPPHVKVEFHELVVKREEGRDPVLGCPTAGWWLEVDEFSLLAVRAIESSPTLADAHERLIRETGEDVDLEGLLDMLSDRGYIARVNGDAYGEPPPPLPWVARVMNRIPVERLRWLQGWAAPALVLLLAVAGFHAMKWDADLRPGFDDLRISTHASLVVLASFGGGLLFASLHEMGHYLVARSYGVQAKLRLSHRLYILVLETDVTNSWVLRPAQRLRIFLAGICVNVAILSVAAIVGLLTALQGNYESRHLIRLIIFLNAFPVAFQLFFFARTDLYYVLSLALKERNLAADSRTAIALYARRLFCLFARRPAEPCPACGGRTHAHEPFCFRCGERRRVENPNEYAIVHASRRHLLAFGLVMTAAQLVALYFMLTMVLRFQASFVARSFSGVVDAAFAEPFDAFVLTDHVVVLLVVGLQVGGMLYFLGRDLGQLALLALRSLAPRIRGLFAPAAPAVPELPVPPKEKP